MIRRERHERQDDTGDQERPPNAFGELATPLDKKMSFGLVNRATPKIANTIDGTPKMTSTASSVEWASHAGRRYSARNTGTAMPSGGAINVPSTARMIVPISGSRIPPPRLTWSPGLGLVVRNDHESEPIPLIPR